MGFLTTWRFARGVAAFGSLALLADIFQGLGVIDISDPTSPREVGSVGTPGTAWDVAITGDLAVVADGDGGLSIVRISGPAKVEGVVTLQGRPSDSGTRVSFNSPETKSVTIGPDGSFSVQLQSGSYVARAQHPGHLPAQATVEVKLGETLKLEAVLLCCDVDQDGDIDLVDLATIAMNFGSGDSDLANLRYTAANLGSSGSAWRVLSGR